MPPLTPHSDFRQPARQEGNGDQRAGAEAARNDLPVIKPDRADVHNGTDLYGAPSSLTRAGCARPALNNRQTSCTVDTLM